MKRWWVVIALLLSVGFNLGLLAAVAGGWWAERPAPAEDGAAVDGGEPAPGDRPDAPVRPGGGDGGFGDGDPAPPPGPGLRPAGGPPLERVADHLGLQGEARQRFVELQRGFVRDLAEARLRRAALDRELRRQLTAAEPDEARIEEVIAAKAELLLAVERTTARTILETRRLLDPEQQRRYLRVLQRLRAGPAGPGGPGGPGAGRVRRPDRFP